MKNFSKSLHLAVKEGKGGSRAGEGEPELLSDISVHQVHFYVAQDMSEKYSFYNNLKITLVHPVDVS